MASRGIWWYVSARTRRSLTLFWAALFVFSLILQYANFANATPTLAVHNDGVFEVADANAVHSTSHDWDQVFADDTNHTSTSGASHVQFITDAVNSVPAEHLFTGGGSKDEQPISAWKWTSGPGVQDKNDIEHAFAAAYTDADGHRVVYFGQDRFAQSGDAFVGFWFLKGSVGEKADHTFSGAHVNGDVLVQVNFTNGGAIQDFLISQWDNGGLTQVATGLDCANAPANDFACGVVNQQDITSPWSYTPKAGSAGTIPTGGFFEAGIDLTHYGLADSCFATFLSETRSSQSLTSTLSDYAFGGFSFCSQPTIETAASPSSITIGGSVTDTATLSGNAGPVTGTVAFFLCGPAGSDPSCATGGDAVGTDTISSGTASVSVTPDAVGHYCFRAEYTPDANSVNKYLPASHTNLGSECFVVNKAQPAISTTGNQQVDAGQQISDSATVTGGFNPTGSVRFDLFANATCTGTPAFTSTVALGANGTAGPVTFTPAAAGTYNWVATYLGDANNNSVAGNCGDTGEVDTVNKVTPVIATTAAESVAVGAAIHDSATVTGGTNPTGSVRFDLYANATCTGTPLFSSTVPLAAGSAGPVSFTPVTAGTYNWVATYLGDANNNSVSGKCGDTGEVDTVNKLSPSIATILVSGNNNGASLNLPLGSTVHDTAALTGATASAGGTVTYTVYSDSSCSTTFAGAGTKAVTNGSVGPSDDVNFPNAGTYYWQAVYSGDANNNGATSLCTSEVLTISPNSVTINTNLSGQGSTGQHITIQIGNSVSDLATLAGQSATAGGTVTYSVYTDNQCQTKFADAGAKTVTNGVVPASNAVTFNTAGTYYWQAVYSGDANNSGATSACTDETVTVIVPDTGIDKTNNDADGIVGHGQTVTYTIKVQVVNGPVTDATITDTLPAGQTYVNGSQTSSPSGAFSISADGRTLTWTYASLATGNPAATLTYGVTIDADAPVGDQTNVAQICVSEVETCKTDDSTVSIPDLTILKDLTSGNTEGTAPDGSPQAAEGDTLLYTLTYIFNGDVAHNGVITDVLPVGLTYVDGSASDNAEFTFDSYDATTRTLTWLADAVTTGGSLTYQVTVDVGAGDLAQPFVNVASIDSDETDKQSDDAQVFVAPPPLAVTSPPKITPPPTDVFDSNGQGTSNPGFSLMLVLLGLAGFVLAIGFVTPVPARARRRDRR